MVCYEECERLREDLDTLRFFSAQSSFSQRPSEKGNVKKRKLREEQNERERSKIWKKRTRKQRKEEKTQTTGYLTSSCKDVGRRLTERT